MLCRESFLGTSDGIKFVARRPTCRGLIAKNSGIWVSGLWASPFADLFQCLEEVDFFFCCGTSLPMLKVRVAVVLFLLVFSFYDQKANPSEKGNVDRILLWQIGDFDDQTTGFDSVPHDDPEIVDFNIGDASSTFPNGLGTDIGSQRSTIRIHFTEDVSEGIILFTIRWSAGNTDVESFSLEFNGLSIGESQVFQGQTPAVFVTEEFVLPNTAQSPATIALRHNQGDGTLLDAIKLERLQPSSNENWGLYE
jgi:hypothetical protein